MKSMRDYLPVKQSDDMSDVVETGLLHSRRSSRRLVYGLIVSNVLTGCAFCFLLIFVTGSGPEDLNADLKRISFYSPILDQIEIPIETVTHDNTLFRSSIYRQAPNPEVDEAWFNLTTPHQYLVSTSDIIAAGKDPSYSVRHPTKPDKHVTMLAVDHQLHCLNDIRRNVFASHYYANATRTPLEIDHTQHCIELIRQTLMCNANLDLITYNWQDIGPDPVPDFKVNMKCRNFDVLREYQSRPAEESGFFSPVDEEGWPWHPKGGEKTVPAPREWWRYLLDSGYVSQGEFDRGNLDKGHEVLEM